MLFKPKLTTTKKTTPPTALITKENQTELQLIKLSVPVLNGTSRKEQTAFSERQPEGSKPVITLSYHWERSKGDKDGDDVSLHDNGVILLCSIVNISGINNSRIIS